MNNETLKKLVEQLKNYSCSNTYLDCTKSRGKTISNFLLHGKPLPNQVVIHILGIAKKLEIKGIDFDKELAELEQQTESKNAPKAKKQAKKDKPTSTRKPKDVDLPQSKDDPANVQTVTAPTKAPIADKPLGLKAPIQETESLQTNLQQLQERVKAMDVLQAENIRLLDRIKQLELQVNQTVEESKQARERLILAHNQEIYSLQTQLAESRKNQHQPYEQILGLTIGTTTKTTRLADGTTKAYLAWYAYAPNNHKIYLGVEKNIEAFTAKIKDWLVKHNHPIPTLDQTTNQNPSPTPANDSAIDDHQTTLEDIPED